LSGIALTTTQFEWVIGANAHVRSTGLIERKGAHLIGLTDATQGTIQPIHTQPIVIESGYAYLCVVDLVKR
jgi:hypothetical protein